MESLEQACKSFILGTAIADTAHDITHIERVVAVAKKLALAENADLDVVIPAAWLHDCVAVPKNHPNRAIASRLAADKATDFLQQFGYDESKLPAIHHAIVAHSFSANVVPESLEAQIVQDADRMDALGAIGISRCMKVGGAIARHVYHPKDPFCETREPDDKLYTLDHFFVKLLKIQNSMHTNAAKEEAQRRTQYMHAFLEQLASEIS
ncbi:HD domain-containing protein [Pseudoalteromonas xiamenensis]|uniref:HD domain-containing protein n=1 Tax=Pseudoalteromonas xiamenensis TaxID=882626 RepID=A0A975HLC5_9GAMM|nr:HD domain-containing protein [Pseudoalteromonas xiamenensis]QTH71951.1 HD domain-containing protein [Pseudoalteromonas xiamenensis]